MPVFRIINAYINQVIFHEALETERRLCEKGVHHVFLGYLRSVCCRSQALRFFRHLSASCAAQKNRHLIDEELEFFLGSLIPVH